MTDASRQAVLTHYRHFLRTLTGHQDFVSDDQTELTVYEWERSGGAFWTYSTLGVSTQGPEQSIELVVTSRQRHLIALSTVLAGVAALRVGSHAHLCVGHTVETREAVIPGSHMHRLWITPSVGEEDAFERVTLENGSVRLLSLVPIHEQEHIYLRQHGDDALWSLFAEDETVLLDLYRDAVPGSEQRVVEPGSA